MPKAIKLNTSKGWITFCEESEDVEDHGCNSCDQPAKRIVSGGPDLLWAVCLGCAEEIECESYQHEYNMIEA
jgi:hypothetical protein